MTVPGDVLGDRYTVERPAWTSSLGPVYKARDPVLDRPVFVQLLDATVAADAQARRTFTKAAAAVAQVQHPAIARVFDIGEEPPFVVFEHAAGGRLSDRLARGPMRVPDAARAALAIARALESLHAAGLHHGALSPTNVLLDAEGRPLVLAIGSGAGSEGEQPEGYRPPGPSTPEGADAYALAALTLHMVTGKPPGKAIARRMTVPSGLASLLQGALHADPSRRPSLERFIGSLAPYVRVEAPRARRPSAVAAEFRWLTPAIVILVVAVLATTIGVSVLRSVDTGPTPTETPTAGGTPGTPLEVSTITDFDPHGSDGQEQPEDVDLALDGDSSTAWRTLNYASADFDKPGVGLLLDLGSSEPIASVRVETGLPGWEAEIRVADEAGDDEEAFTEVASFTAGSETDVELPADTTARYVLLWITRAVVYDSEAEYPHRAEVAEVSVLAA